MKVFFRIFILTFASIFFMILGNSASAQTYFGEVCWLIQDVEDEEASIAVFGLTDQGDNHFILNGRVIDPDDPEDDTLIDGSAEVVGDQVILKLNAMFSDDDEIGSFNVIAKLALDTFTGPFDAIATFIDPSTEEFGIELVSGTFTLTECP